MENNNPIKKNNIEDIIKELRETREGFEDIHKGVKDLGYDTIVEILKKNNFPNPEEEAKKILES